MPQNNIHIQVQTQHIDDHPVSEEGKFAFAYFIDITNQGDKEVQLLNRYWLITDGNGKQTEVSGAGVVGKQPTIAPRQTYQYSSGAILDTPVGSMQGHYEMQTSDGHRFKAPIEVFTLAVPSRVN